MTHLLDTSAFLAFFFNEEGGGRVGDLFQEENHAVAFSSLSIVEFWSRLHAIGEEQIFEEEWKLHQPLFEAVLEVDGRVAERAVVIRRHTPTRVPTIDSLIAATASLHDLVLVHREPHFRAIPASLLRQLDLGGS